MAYHSHVPSQLRERREIPWRRRSTASTTRTGGPTTSRAKEELVLASRSSGARHQASHSSLAHHHHPSRSPISSPPHLDPPLPPMRPSRQPLHARCSSTRQRPRNDRRSGYLRKPGARRMPERRWAWLDWTVEMGMLMDRVRPVLMGGRPASLQEWRDQSRRRRRLRQQRPPALVC